MRTRRIELKITEWDHEIYEILITETLWMEESKIKIRIEGKATQENTFNVGNAREYLTRGAGT